MQQEMKRKFCLKGENEKESEVKH
uniref:Uncharacterized protein n=1 Tax=Arundo donax TaxID=35708 RepID=A0A0A9H734_ARUDO